MKCTIYPNQSYAEVYMDGRNIALYVYSNGDIEIELYNCSEGSNTFILNRIEMDFINSVMDQFKYDNTVPVTLVR